MKIATLGATGLLLVALAGCGGSAATQNPATASSAPVASAPAGVATAITVKDFTLDPKDVAAQGTVSLAVSNAGPTIHNIAIRDGSGKVVGTTKDLKAGEAETLTVDLAAGSYTLFCSLPGHESLGIKGSLTLTE